MSLPSSDHLNILHWISNCDRLHPDCPPTPNQNRQPHEIPSWVIDIQDGRIVAGISAPRYVALSYVWPAMNSDKVTLALKMGNLGQLQEKGFLLDVETGSLPEVISDAIKLAKQLGERYLWIDRLCIVQDGEMKDTEIKHMGSIYSGAHFTVIAAASSGLYGNLELRGQPNRSASSPTHLYNQLLKSKWATRGWTFQEQILSQRSVVFIDGNVFWDCQRSVWSNGGPEPEAEANMGASRHQEQLGHAMAVAVVPSTVFADFRLYREFVCLYSDRDLTYPQDALAAFSGIIGSLSRTYPGGFVGGLPVLFLDAALLWQPFSNGKRRISVQGRAEDSDMPSAHLPSWSWCGWQVIVDPGSLHVRSLEWLRPELRTQQQVRWSILSDDLQRKEKLPEPAILEDYCRRFLEGNDTNLPEGWSRHQGPPSHSTSTYSDDELPATNPRLTHTFTHIADPTKLFSHPIPIIKSDGEPAATQTWPYLCCETTTGIFKVESIISRRSTSGWVEFGIVKVSVTSLDKFRRGPDQEKMCRIVSLADASGKPAGLLRIMDDTEIKPGQDMELMAISSGSMGWNEISSSFDEKIDLFASVQYNHGSTTTIHEFKRDPPFEGSQKQAESARWRASRPWGGKGDYRFYNVLWIERKGGIAYRRAAGRVVKNIWEANCTKKAKVVLG